MKKITYLISLIGIIFYMVTPVEAETVDTETKADICKIRCRTDEGIICLERGSCEPINAFLLRAAKNCRENVSSRYAPISRLLFVDIFSQLIRLDRELPSHMENLKDEERYALEARLLAEKGIDIFVDTDPLDPLTRKELAVILRDITIEKDLGYSTGLREQSFDLNNEAFVIYNVKIYVDEGSGFELWEMKKNLKESAPENKHYAVKLDSCGEARIVFGDSERDRIPAAASRIKVSYQFYGRKDEVVTECEIVMLLSHPDLVRSVKNAYNPSRPLTKINFADLLLKTMQLGTELSRESAYLSEEELYLLQIEILSRNGIDIFVGSSPEDLLMREELARVLYDSPVEEIIGISDGKGNQRFELENAGFVIYDLHVYVKEGLRFKEWSKKDSFIESSSKDKDYVVKLDAGNYASVYFGDARKGKIPEAKSPIKVTYRLYAPLAMLTEDDIICVLGKMKPVAETYIPPTPPFEFPDPTDGYNDPATHI